MPELVIFSSGHWTPLLTSDLQVGRIIGKGGQNVREMQRLTGAVIKLPEQVSYQRWFRSGQISSIIIIVFLREHQPERRPVFT